MSTPTPDPGSVLRRSPIARFLRWSLRPRIIGRLLGVLLTVATLVALFYAEERWRGARAWERYRAEMSARGVRLDWEAYLPPRVADYQNLAMTPCLAPLLDFLPGTQIARDTNRFQETARRGQGSSDLARKLGFNLGSARHGDWQKAERTDFIALLGSNRHTAAAPDEPAPAVARPAPPSTQREAAAILLDIQRQTVEPVFDELRAASQRPHCRFNIRYEYAPIAGILLPHLAMVRGLITNLVWRISAELELGRTEEAFSDVRLAMTLADGVREEPFLMSHLFRLASRQKVTQAVWEGLSRHQWTDQHLRWLEQRLAHDDFARDLLRSLEAERACGVRTAEHLRAGLVTPSQLASLEVTANLGEAARTLLGYCLPSGWFYFEQVNYCQTCDQYLVAVDRWQSGKMDTRGLLGALAALDQRAKPQTLTQALREHRFLEAMVLPPGLKLYGMTLEAAVPNDLARVACALERHFLAHGEYPEHLDALAQRHPARAPKDILSGQSFVYRRESPVAFVLYSVGHNLADDGGTVVLGIRGEVDRMRGDWVWRQPRP